MTERIAAMIDSFAQAAAPAAEAPISTSELLAHDERLKMDGAGFIDVSDPQFTDGDHAVWNELCQRRFATLDATASRAWIEAADLLGIRGAGETGQPGEGGYRIPGFPSVNRALQDKTGWQVQAADGLVPADSFFAALSQRIFPSTIAIRPMHLLEYLQEPDIFHDLFGHVPMHADPVFADFAQRYGRLGVAVQDAERREMLARLYWYTFEFGLIREAQPSGAKALRLYGAGLISSLGEGDHALKADGGPELRDFDLEQCLSTPFRIDVFQPLLFVIDSFEQVRDAVAELERRWLD